MAARVVSTHVFADMKVYHGTRTEHGSAVVVEENGQCRGLDPRRDLATYSSNGFDWGQYGDEATQLALALAADVLGDDQKAQELCRRLKFKLIGGLPDQGWVLTEDRIRSAIGAIEQQQAHAR